MKTPDEPLVSDTPITDASCAMVYLASGSAFEAADPAVSRKLERDLAGALRESEDRNQQWAAKSIYASQLERGLAAHRTVLEKCEKAFYRVIVLCEDDPADRLNRPAWLTEVIDEVAKLRGGAA